MNELRIDFDLERLRLAVEATVLVGEFLSSISQRRSIRRHFSAMRDRTVGGWRVDLMRRKVLEFME